MKRDLICLFARVKEPQINRKVQFLILLKMQTHFRFPQENALQSSKVQDWGHKALTHKWLLPSPV